MSMSVWSGSPVLRKDRKMSAKGSCWKVVKEQWVRGMVKKLAELNYGEKAHAHTAK